MSFGRGVNLIHLGAGALRVGNRSSGAQIGVRFDRRFAVDLRPWGHMSMVEASAVDSHRVTWTTDAGRQMDEIDRIIGAAT